MSWEEIRISDLGKVITGKTPPTSVKENYGGNIPFITPSDMIGNRTVNETERYISNKGKETVKNCVLPPHSVCVSCIGSDMGKAVITSMESISNQQINSIICSPEYDYRFVYYQMLLLRDTIRSLGKNATAVPILNKSKFSDIRIFVPQFSEQKRIADILSDYDDLIENNQKQIKLLEEAAQRLYKEWFVDLRFPGYENTKIVDGVPEGWKVIRIGDAFQTLLGGTPSRENFEYWKNGTIPWINSGKVNELRVIEPSEYITESALNKSATKLLPKHTTIVAITGATLGQVSYTEIETCANQSVVGIIDESQLYSEYIYCYVLNSIKSIIGKATGGAQQHINKDIVNSYPIILPCDTIAIKFNEIVKQYFEKVRVLLIENVKLAEKRDRLLPKLMSGELEV